MPTLHGGIAVKMSTTSMKKVGVLSLQGSVAEHMKILRTIEGVLPIEAKTAEDIAQVDGLIIPGGESTTLGKLINYFDMKNLLISRIEKGMPVWGTCAGMILLAKEIADESTVHLGVMDIKVRRNAYGGQLQSFISSGKIEQVSNFEIPLVFIRAPWIEEVKGDCEALLTLEGKIAAARQNKMLVTSFHPELAHDNSFHKFFCKLVD